MQPLFVTSFLVAAVVAPSPQPTTLKTIVTVHSSQFCTALEKWVRPALAGLMQNDKLIERGHATFVAAGDRVKHGSVAGDPAYLTGPPVYSPSPGDTVITEMRQRQQAKSIEDNVEAVEAILADKAHFSAVTASDENAKLAAIASQLNAVAAKQRTAVNVISGQVEGAELAALFNANPSWGGADAPHGVSPLTAMEAGHGFDGHAIYDVWQADTETKVPFYDPYELFTIALEDDQHLIAQAEDDASKSVVEAAAGCK